MEEQLGYPRRLLLSHTMARSLDQVHPGQLGTNVTHILKRARYLVDYPVFRAANKAGRDIHRPTRKRPHLAGECRVKEDAIRVQSSLEALRRAQRCPLGSRGGRGSRRLTAYTAPRIFSSVQAYRGSQVRRID